MVHQPCRYDLCFCRQIPFECCVRLAPAEIPHFYCAYVRSDSSAKSWDWAWPAGASKPKMAYAHKGLMAPAALHAHRRRSSSSRRLPAAF